MNDLQAILEGLEDRELDYVLERSKVSKDSQALRAMGISPGTFYGWEKNKRDHLNELAQELKRASAVRATMILQGAVEEAANVKIEGLKEKRDKRLKQNVATEILDRQLGKPTQRQETELSTKDDKPIFIVSHIEDDSAADQD